MKSQSWAELVPARKNYEDRLPLPCLPWIATGLRLYKSQPRQGTFPGLVSADDLLNFAKHGHYSAHADSNAPSPRFGARGT